MKPELLAPAGNEEKLRTALYFGADAVYLGGKSMSLRAQADNFDYDTLSRCVAYAHGLGKKVYVAVNIFARNVDFVHLGEYLAELCEAGVDGVIVSDLGIIDYCRRHFPALPVHVSTQANTLNKFAASVYADMGCKRIVLARELALREIREIYDAVGERVELEAFAHGAMCISYSGRCLLSDYLTDRPSNRGMCVQACRWEYEIHEVSHPDNPLLVTEDERGTYLLNSKDLNMIRHLGELSEAGVSSLKIEGRMKTAYYVATVVNAYRRALDGLDKPFDESLAADLYKASNRGFTTGFYFGRQDAQNRATSAPLQTCDFVAVVEEADKGSAVVRMKNRFRKGEELEILSPGAYFNRTFALDGITDEQGAPVDDVKLVGQRVRIDTPYPLHAGDILRRNGTKQ